MINRVILTGRLTKDPELRYTPSGVAVVKFTLAVNRPFTNQRGEREADFISCIAWRKTAENVANYLAKGSVAGVDGRLQTRSYEAQDGRRVYVTEVVAESVRFLGSNRSNQSGSHDEPYGEPYPFGPSGYNDDPFKNAGQPVDFSYDDLPF